MSRFDLKRIDHRIVEIGEKLCYCICEDGGCRLGRGSYGIVFKGKFKVAEEDNQVEMDVAVKRVDRFSIKIEDEILRLVNGHPNILRYYATEENNDFFFIVTELCIGTLYDLVISEREITRQHGEGRPTDVDLITIGRPSSILRQIVEGLRHLHNKKIVHRDLNPHNILYSLSSDGAGSTRRRPVMKLADFGMSRMVPEKKSHLTRTQLMDGYSPVFIPFGTDGWIAPEILNGQRTYKKSVDIFPLGLIFGFTLSEGRHPFDVDPPKENETIAESEKRTTSRNERIRNKMPMTLTAEQLNDGIGDQRIVTLLQMIQSMLSADPSKRPTAAQIQNHYGRILKDPKKEKELLLFSPSRFSRDGTVVEDVEDALNRLIELVTDEEAVDINCTLIGWGGHTPLIRLCRCSSDSLDRYVEILLQRPDINVKQTDAEGMNALMWLCQYSRSVKIVQVAQLLIENGTDVNHKGKNGYNAFMWLMHWPLNSDKSVEMTRLLISNGLDINQTDKVDGLNAFMWLCGNSNSSDKIVEVAQLLIENGVEVNKTDNKEGYNALMLLFYWRQVAIIRIAEMVKLLIANGVDANHTDKTGKNVLILCCGSKCDKVVEVAQILIENGVDINKTDENGWNALMRLLYLSDNNKILEIAQFLIANGTDLNQTNQSGENALMILCTHSKSDKIVEIAQFLIANGTDLNQTNQSGENALMILCTHSKSDKIVEMAQFLIANGADLNKTNKYGENALMILCTHSKSDKIVEMAQLLIANDTDLNQTNEYKNILHRFKINYGQILSAETREKLITLLNPKNTRALEENVLK